MHAKNKEDTNQPTDCKCSKMVANMASQIDVKLTDDSYSAIAIVTIDFSKIPDTNQWLTRAL